MKTILIVEDDKDILEMLSATLQAEGYQVRTGHDVTALYEIEKDPPALILLDNWLDGKTGHDICVNLKSSPKTRQIPVALISATLNLERTAESCGADGFLKKPFELDDLIRLVAGLTASA